MTGTAIIRKSNEAYYWPWHWHDRHIRSKAIMTEKYLMQVNIWAGSGSGQTNPLVAFSGSDRNQAPTHRYDTRFLNLFEKEHTPGWETIILLAESLQKHCSGACHLSGFCMFSKETATYQNLFGKRKHCILYDNLFLLQEEVFKTSHQTALVLSGQ